MPAPISSADPAPSTFTRRPLQKSEAEIKMEERAAAKKVSYFDFILFYLYFKFCLRFRKN
jgi:hypothetical protein